jgi:hypothetical protein
MNLYRKSRIIATGLLSLLLSIVFSSCLPIEGCEDAATNPLRIGFYRTAAATGRSTAIAIDSLTVFGVNRPDSLLYNNRKNVRTIEVPLNPASDSTRFVLVFPGNVIDTLLVMHLRQPILISADCGFTMYYDINQVKHSLRFIQSNQIIQPLVKNTLEEHLRIFITSDPGN